VLRVDPATGNGVPGNPIYTSQNPSSNASRIIGYGLRNPFRFTFRPGTSELWVGDVGWNTWEEVNRMTTPTPSSAVNFGWPCYEGAGEPAERQSSYDSANLNICEEPLHRPQRGRPVLHLPARGLGGRHRRLPAERRLGDLRHQLLPRRQLPG
jgi:hypothetical protein